MKRREFLKKSMLAAVGTALLGDRAIGRIAEEPVSASAVNSNGKAMKIVVLTGSPRRNGNSAYLAEQFIKGAEERGHEVFRFDCAFKKVAPCRACCIGIHRSAYKFPRVCPANPLSDGSICSSNRYPVLS